jgi:phage-related minor tail protein
MLFGGGRSAGGSVAGGTSYVVGERGPELFVPQSAGKIISNSALKGSGQPAGGSGGAQTTVNYNIQAVDAASFRSLVAKDPSFIYAVTEQGRRSQPTRSR